MEQKGESSSAGPSGSTAVTETGSYRQTRRDLDESFKQPQGHPETPSGFEAFLNHGVPPARIDSSTNLASFTGAAISSQEARDGAEVSYILSAEVGADETMDVGDDAAMTPDTAASLRHALFDGMPRSSGLWDDLLNFRPSFLEGRDGRSEESRLHMGTSDTSSAANIWLLQWNEVLNNYTDEVWGDLGPLVAQAKHEVAELVTRQPEKIETPDTPAINRLRQILGHVRGGRTRPVSEPV
ncbi:hypothetical protein B0I35DRAFT_475380 [Stachybotrys elegans]|uniref:Uncharacterized protein n=1 Tax=Stachybotrys elegans TaxID=80388 RepID=A0A8K0SZD3_9HYPO|nr:hypothetical protein B0I35DRAFT_475380 [Stachybotrys elegans]